jgi:hypothetical protein
MNINYSFENGLNPWVTGFDLPLDPNNSGKVVPWSVEQSDLQAIIE